MKPVIGIFAAIDAECTTSLLYPYISSIEGVGGIPVLLPYVEEEETVERLIELCDGFFFTGGADIEPMRYGEEKEPACGATQPNRDSLEFRAFSKVLQTKKPILGVCRGAQVINTALGGTLWQDIPSVFSTSIAHKQSEPRFSPSHGVKILADTPLHALMGADRMRANSFHHQAVKALGKGLEVMAVADDGIVEAFYLPGARYVRAYQWHPERLYAIDERNRRIFQDFIEACRGSF